VNHYYGCSRFADEHHQGNLEVYFYDTLDTVQNAMPRYNDDSLPPMAEMNHHLYSTLRGCFLAEPGDVLHLKNGTTLTLYKHIVMMDRYFFLDLTKGEYQALLYREEVTYRHFVKTGERDHMLSPKDYFLSHDTTSCIIGANAKDLRQALKKSSRFEYRSTARYWNMGFIERFVLRVLYFMLRFNAKSRLRMKNLKQLEAKPPLRVVGKNY
jgi:hypothetical protein